MVSSYETKPQRGWRKRPMVPRTHTVTNTQRKILSITMATYFQSSSTCEGGSKNNECETTEESVNSDKCKMKSERFFFIKAGEERCTVRGNG